MLGLLFSALPISAIAEENCSTYKTEEKCDDAYSCSWDNDLNTCKKMPSEMEESESPKEEEPDHDFSLKEADVHRR